MIYKLINNFENYAIYENGEILDSNSKIIKPINSVYPTVVLMNSEGVRKTFLLHRLLALHFIPNPETKPQVNHINGDKKDYRLSNLEWCTNAENIQHAYDSNLYNKSHDENGKCIKTDIINWSELSLLLTGNRTQIRSNNYGKKYARQINGLKRLIEFWVKWIA